MHAAARELHVVFGAGQVGGLLAAKLLEHGLRVRVAKRSPAGIPEGAEAVLGDAADPEFCLHAAAGASVLYHCMNPPYSTRLWERYVPLFMDNLIGAAVVTGSRLVVLDNLYMIGSAGGRPINEETPMYPRSRKGRIRARVEERLFQAIRSRDVRAVVGRASDFYGPGGFGTHFGAPFWKPVFHGKPGQLVINPDQVHSYHYIPDVAAGLAELGRASEDALGTAWILPCAPAETSRALIGRFSQALGQEIRIHRLPRALLRLTGIFVPLLKEVDEMLHQWEEPFIADDSRFRERFGLLPTPPDEGATSTVAWARGTWQNES